MASIQHGLSGCYELSNTIIDAVVRFTRPGAYALGTALNQSILQISYVGRADSDLNARLKQHVGRYRDFQFVYTDSAYAAFAKECWLYHTFNPGGNQIHPARPLGALTCPTPGCRTLF